MRYVDCGPNDNPDPPPEQESREERERREEAMLDAYDDRRWWQMKKSLDGAQKVEHETRITRARVILEVECRKEYTCAHCGKKAEGTVLYIEKRTESLTEARAALDEIENDKNLSVEHYPLGWGYINGEFLCMECKWKYYDGDKGGTDHDKD